MPISVTENKTFKKFMHLYTLQPEFYSELYN